MVLACLPKVSDGADMCWPMVLMGFLDRVAKFAKSCCKTVRLCVLCLPEPALEI